MADSSVTAIDKPGDWLAKAESLTGSLSRAAGFIGVVGMLVIGALSALDVIVLRSVFNRPITGSNEFLSTIFAVAISSVLASGLAQRASLEIDFLQNIFSDRVNHRMRLFGHTLYLLILCLTCWKVLTYTIDATAMGKITMLLQWPMWPFLFAITFFFWLCIPVQIVAVLALAVEVAGGDAPGAGDRTTVLPRALAMAGVAVACAMGVVAAFYFGSMALQPFLQGNSTAFSVGMFVLLWVLILIRLPVAAALIATALIGAGVLMGYSQALSVLGSETVGLITNQELAVLPLFMMMGAFAGVAGLSSDIYRLAHASFAMFRGGLALATVGGCAGFGALTGSSLATVATIGSVALPEMRSRGYSMELSAGSIAAGGTLGQLVPPSTAIVLYAILIEQSIGRLYIAVLVPALLTALLYGLAIVLYVALTPGSAPGKSAFDRREFFDALYRCKGVFFMFAAVIGGIFAGVFTATEAAAVGATIAFLIALIRGKISRASLWTVIGETTRSTSMLYFVIIGAMVISFFFGTSGLPQTLLDSLTGLGLSGLSVIILLTIIFVILGMVMDSFTIMIVTAGLAASIVQNLGYDPIWWGIMMVIIVELGVVTPPFGMNLFVMKSIATDLTMGTIFRGVVPFILADVVKIALLIAFPALVLWLPNLAFN
ncbi:MAG: TRAP transporter large permease subunit [Hyphomicrobiales bacterium]|nr:TRAP transporter large permease subunit [Hyphomicrobiales bacterium]